MSRTTISGPAEALAGMARVGSPRVPMNTSAIKDFHNASADSAGPTKRPRGAKAHGDPTAPGTAKIRPHNSDPAGAAHAIKASISAPVSAEAGKTLANGRLLPSAVPRNDFDRVGFRAESGH